MSTKKKIAYAAVAGLLLTPAVMQPIQSVSALSYGSSSSGSTSANVSTTTVMFLDAETKAPIQKPLAGTDASNFLSKNQSNKGLLKVYSDYVSVTKTEKVTQKLDSSGKPILDKDSKALTDTSVVYEFSKKAETAVKSETFNISFVDSDNKKVLNEYKGLTSDKAAQFLLPVDEVLTKYSGFASVSRDETSLVDADGLRTTSVIYTLSKNALEPSPITDPTEPINTSDTTIPIASDSTTVKENSSFIKDAKISIDNSKTIGDQFAKETVSGSVDLSKLTNGISGNYATVYVKNANGDNLGALALAKDGTFTGEINIAGKNLKDGEIVTLAYGDGTFDIKVSTSDTATNDAVDDDNASSTDVTTDSSTDTPNSTDESTDTVIDNSDKAPIDESASPTAEEVDASKADPTAEASLPTKVDDSNSTKPTESLPATADANYNLAFSSLLTLSGAIGFATYLLRKFKSQ